MRALVVHAHPAQDSFNHALFTAVREGLDAAGHAVRVADLYRDGFDPVLSEAEWRRNLDHPANMAGLERQVEDLRWADTVILVFPTWWYGMPAILKGYLDRVWMAGVAFHLPDGPGPIRPGLPQIRRLDVVTTAGAPHWFTRLVIGHPNKKTIQRGLGMLVGRRAAKHWMCLYGMDRADAGRRARFLDRVRRRYAGIR